MKRILLAIIFAAVPASIVQAANHDSEMQGKKSCGKCHRPWRFFGNGCCKNEGKQRYACDKDRCAKNRCRNNRAE